MDMKDDVSSTVKLRKFGETLVWRIAFRSRLAEEKLANLILNNIKIANWQIKV